MTPSGDRPRKPFWILPVIVFSQFAGTSIWFSGNAVLTELVQAGSAGSSLSGWITGAVQIGFITGTLVFAFFSISDRFSPRLVFLLCTVAGALFNLSIIIACTSLVTLLLLRFAAGFFLAGIYPVGMKIAAGWYEKGLGNALGFLIGALVLGTAFPHLLKGGFSALSWQAVMAVSSGVCLFGGLLMALLVPDGPYLKTAPVFDPRALTALFRRRLLRAAALGYFGHMWELYTLWAFVPVFLGAYASQNPDVFLNLPVWSFAIIGIGSLGCIVGGMLSIRHGSAVVAAVQLAVSGLCCLLSPLIFALSPQLFLSLMLLWGITVVGDSPQFSAMVARTAPGELVGSALTLVNCIGFSITVVSLAVVQWLATAVPLQYLLMVLAVGPAAGLIAMRPLSRNKK
ncbi:membrane protein [Desulfosarcina widdelii]|uniref:Membrane protein n=1 Tax=Desulfosarcina widdelii TaxID=947919 RepID=A0A5K7Z129_9BACT|nr:MFS transporter [Desulfosarcina widdelii]BBO73939.1 membrane protein [Desulfosarcina widdelii]